MADADAAGTATDQVLNQPGGIFANGPLTTVQDLQGDWQDKFERAGRDLVDHFRAGVKTADGWARAEEDAEREAANIATLIRTTQAGSFADVGKALGGHFADGLASGIKSGQLKVGIAGAEVAAAAVSAVRKTLDSHSPSRVLYQEGVNAIDGLIGGWESKSLDPITVPAVATPRPLSGAALAGIDERASQPGLFPPQVTLVDRNGSLLGIFDVVISDRLREQEFEDQMTIRMGKKV